MRFTFFEKRRSLSRYAAVGSIPTTKLLKNTLKKGSETMEEKQTAQPTELSSAEQYLLRLRKFWNFYLALIISIGVACAVSIVVAVVSNVLLGAALAIFSVSVYIYLCSDEMKKMLGLSYSNMRGHIEITKAKPAEDGTLYIPSRLIFTDVTHIGDGAFCGQENTRIQSIYLPLSIEYIGRDVFGDAEELPVIYYEGDRERWESVRKDTPLDGLSVVFDTQMPQLIIKKEKTPSTDKDGEDGI